LLAQAGLPALEVVRAATLYPARFFAQSEDPPFGVVRVGKRADLVLVNGNPLEQIAAISNLRAVILGGVPLLRLPVTASGAEASGKGDGVAFLPFPASRSEDPLRVSRERQEGNTVPPNS